MTYSLELTITKTDGSTDYDFVTVAADNRAKAVEDQTKNLETRIQKAKSGNPIWANHSQDYKNWETFELV